MQKWMDQGQQRWAVLTEGIRWGPEPQGEEAEGGQCGVGVKGQTMSWQLSDTVLGERKGTRQRGPPRRPQRK